MIIFLCTQERLTLVGTVVVWISDINQVSQHTTSTNKFLNNYQSSKISSYGCICKWEYIFLLRCIFVGPQELFWLFFFLFFKIRLKNGHPLIFFFFFLLKLTPWRSHVIQIVIYSKYLMWHEGEREQKLKQVKDVKN